MANAFRDFDPAVIRAGLTADSSALLHELTVLEVVDSTNLYLSRLPIALQHGHAVVANQQESGRGRRGRSWHSPPGGNIYLSLGWKLAGSANTVTQLPLVVAVALATALRSAGVKAVGIKWPNDILVAGKKLAGILLEARQAGTGRMVVVLGVGVNVRMPIDTLNRNPVEQAWTDVCSQLPGLPGEDFRDRLCGMVLHELLRSLDVFDSSGFSAFSAEWARLDMLHGRAVDIMIGGESTHETVTGMAAGISSRGGLLARCPDARGQDTLQEFLAGDVSIRLC
jgi:BirA family biotin operon repressor/biotin-[acetyl-CoA-carboxylase] ligase